MSVMITVSECGNTRRNSSSLSDKQNNTGLPVIVFNVIVFLIVVFGTFLKKKVCNWLL